MSRIEIHEVTKTFAGVTALNHVTVNFEQNHIYGLLGRNGAGKTTLLNLITGRLFPDSGEILSDGEKILENDNKLSKMYYMTEGNLYPERMRVKEAFVWSKKFYPEFQVEYAKSLCEKFELNQKQKIQNLSTGYSSILKIIIALASGCEVVLMDEPVLGLDANHRELFYKELIQNFTDSPRTFILSTHLIEEVANIVDRVIIVKKGEVIMDDDVQNVLALGCTVSGPSGAVDDFIRGKKVLGCDTLGGLKSAYLLGQYENVPQGLELNRLDLQKLFIQLTNA